MPVGNRDSEGAPDLEVMKKYEAVRSNFWALVDWHLTRGTRPDPGLGSVTPGQPWSNKKFAAACGVKVRTVQYWRQTNSRKPRTVPPDLAPIEREFFGTNKAYNRGRVRWREDLREAYSDAQKLNRLNDDVAGALRPIDNYHGIGGIEECNSRAPDDQPPKSHTLSVSSVTENNRPQPAPIASTMRDPGLCRGRDDQIAGAVEALTPKDGNAAVLVLGDMGHGKTTLTEKVGVHPAIRERFGDRRLFIELELASSARGALEEIAAAIGMERTAPLPAVVAQLSEKPVLLVLDNLETPLHADQEMEALLRDLVAVPHLGLMASLCGHETVTGVDWTDQIRLEALPRNISREVFLAIASNISKDDPDLDFFLSELDDIPQAISLVARRASTRKTLAPLRREWERRGAVLATRLGSEGGRRDSIVASVDFSLRSRRLHATGKRLFSILGQLPAGMADKDLDTLIGDAAYEAAEELRVVGLLKEQDNRLRLPSPIRDVARRQHPPENADATPWTEHYLALARDEGERVGKEGGMEAITRLTPEMPNIGVALMAFADTPKGRAAALSVIDDFARTMSYTGTGAYSVFADLARVCASAGDRVGEAKCLLARAGTARMRSRNKDSRADYLAGLALLRGTGEAKAEADCLCGLAEIALEQDNNYMEARRLYGEAQKVYKGAGALTGEAQCLRGLAEIALEQDDYTKARKLYERAQKLYKGSGALTGEADCLWGLAEIALEQDDYTEVRRLYGEAQKLYKGAGALTGEAQCLRGLAAIAWEQDDYTEAQCLYKQAQKLYKDADVPSGEAQCLRGLAEIALEQDDYTEARELYERAQKLYKGAGVRTGEADCLWGLAEIALEQDEYTEVRRLYGEAQKLYKGAGGLTGEAQCLCGLADIARMEDKHAEARGLYEQAQKLYKDADVPSGEAHCLWG
jgi:tetratricopeptide (TPR) repeat protein